MEKIELGDIVRDTITGYRGKVMAITDWLNSCRRVSVQALELDRDGKPRDLQSFDEMQVEIVERDKPAAARVATGGPRNDAAALRRQT